jgi:ribosomal protein L11 methyltransferase
MSYHQFLITLPDPVREIMVDRLMALGSLGIIEGDGTVTAYFPANSSPGSIVQELEISQELLSQAGHRFTLKVEHSILPDADWNESWKKSFKPVDVGTRFLILPPWEHPSGNRIPLVIEPGMAFGTGHHETTRSCLVLMEKFAASVKKERFLDIGTGTGLLAIAARILGFKQVVGVDTDPLAIEASRKNIMLNHRDGIELREGGIDCATGTYDMIAANLISGTLVELAGEIASRLAPAGIVIMSGILKGQDDEVVRAAESSGSDCIERFNDGKWVTLACRH